MESSPERMPAGPAEPGSATAVWFTEERRIELRSEKLPAVGAEEVRVRTIASGLSSGTEMLVYRGQVPCELELDLPTMRGNFGFPIKYGYACVGRVIEKADTIRNLELNDLVFVHHPHQTQFVVPASMPVRLPSDLPPEAGVLFANVETAINVMLDAHPRLGERVAVFGQGVVGLLLTQLLRQAGTATVLAIDPVARRRHMAEVLGADAALAPDDGLPETVRRLTGGQGADIVIEASGNPSALAQALECIASEGTVVVCSWYGTKPVSVPLGGAFHRGRLRLVSSQVGSINPCLSARWTRERRTALAVALLAQLPLLDLVTHRIPFEHAADAYDLVDRQPEEAVQVILTYPGDG